MRGVIFSLRETDDKKVVSLWVSIVERVGSSDDV